MNSYNSNNFFVGGNGFKYLEDAKRYCRENDFSFECIIDRYNRQPCKVENWYMILNTKTGENHTRVFTPAQLGECIRDGFDMIIPIKGNR